MNALVSIILPVYNSEKYIYDTIDSILSQTFKEFELIIINDCSTDKSEEIIQLFKDLRIRYIKNDENLKLIATLNKGISLSKTHLIARCDADDICHIDRIKRQYDFLQNHTDVGIIGTDAWIIDEHNKLIGINYNMAYNSRSVEARLLYNSPFFHPSVMFRKDLFNNVGQYPNGYIHAEDYALWANFFDKTLFLNLTDKLICYRKHKSSISSIYLEQQVSAKKLIQTTILKDAKKIYLKKWGFKGRFALYKEEIWTDKKEPKKQLKLFLKRPLTYICILLGYFLKVTFKFFRFKIFYFNKDYRSLTGFRKIN